MNRLKQHPAKGYTITSWDKLLPNDTILFCTWSEWFPVFDHHHGVVKEILIEADHPSITITKKTGKTERYKTHELNVMYFWRRNEDK